MRRRNGQTTLALVVAISVVAPASCRRPPPAPPMAAPLGENSRAAAVRETPAPVPGGIDRSRPAPPDVAAPPADALVTASGLRTRVLTPGTGRAHPGKTDFVEVAYTGWRKSGGFFEGTGDGERVRFDRHEIVPGLDEGIGLMVEGEKRRFWIPLALAYGARPDHVNAPHEDMTFDVQLLKIVPLPPTPADVARAPRNAVKTRSGLAFRYLHRGTGTSHPTAGGWIQIRESMWTAKGQLFYTSLRVADVVRSMLGDLPPGAEEAAQRMVEGDRLRLWVPGQLAFGEDRPDEAALPFARPRGPIVIDLELVKAAD